MRRIRFWLGRRMVMAGLRLTRLSHAGFAAMLVASHMPREVQKRAKVYDVTARDADGGGLYELHVVEVPVAAEQLGIPQGIKALGEVCAGFRPPAAACDAAMERLMASHSEEK